MHKIIVVTGPSAVGKTFLADILTSEYADEIVSAKVVTTRTPRAGETGTDRLFVSVEAYEQMKSKGEFVVHGEFGGNSYGYTAEALDTTLVQKSIIINTWPAMIPEFQHIHDVVIIGLSVEKAYLPLLEKRLKDRAESADVYEKRRDLIRQDIEIMAHNFDRVATKGRTFYIEDDSSLRTDVLPYILQAIRGE